MFYISDIPQLSYIILEDGDIVKITGPFEEPLGPYTHFYQNKDTRELDNDFGLLGYRIKPNDYRSLNLFNCLRSIQNRDAQITLEHFVRIALNIEDHFIGIRENEFVDGIEKFKLGNIDLENVVDIYCNRKYIDCEPVLFPRYIPHIPYVVVTERFFQYLN